MVPGKPNRSTSTQASAQLHPLCPVAFFIRHATTSTMPSLVHLLCLLHPPCSPALARICKILERSVRPRRGHAGRASTRVREGERDQAQDKEVRPSQASEVAWDSLSCFSSKASRGMFSTSNPVACTPSSVRCLQPISIEHVLR